MIPVDPLVLLAFGPAALALNLTPGADMMFCLGQGLRSGARGGWAASAGISIGVMVHVTLAGLGLAAVIAAAPWALTAIRWAGVGYLLWLAVQTLRHPIGGASPSVSHRAFRDGLLVNLANPKVILFVLAFIPQFVDPGHGPVLPQFLAFGAVLALGGFAINGLVGTFAGGLGRQIARSPRLARTLSYTSAGIFTALALRLVLEERA